MIGTEIMNLLNENIGVLGGGFCAAISGLFSLFIYRRKITAEELQKIKAGKFKEVIDELLENGEITYIEFFKARNFLSIASKADEYYKRNSKENEKKDFGKDYNLDWFIRFYESAGNISDEELQDLWARLLAGELDRPFSYSLRLLDVLRNMTQADAKMFELICSYSFNSDGDYFLPHYDEYLNGTEIEYADIMRMSEHGLIFDSGLIQLQFSPNDTDGILLSNRELVMLYHVTDLNNRKFVVEQYAFTSVGKELASLKGICAENDRFCRFAEILNNRFKNIRVEVRRADEMTEER